jgi:hypothetical protein
MTRDEYRAKCIEAMKAAYVVFELTPEHASDEFFDLFTASFTAIFDSLHGIAHVVPIEATEEMSRSGGDALMDSQTIDRQGLDPRFRYSARDFRRIDACAVLRAMSAAGDLTNPPEGKP